MSVYWLRDKACSGFNIKSSGDAVRCGRLTYHDAYRPSKMAYDPKSKTESYQFCTTHHYMPLNLLNHLYQLDFDSWCDGISIIMFIWWKCVVHVKVTGTFVNCVKALNHYLICIATSTTPYIGNAHLINKIEYVLIAILLVLLITVCTAYLLFVFI